MLRVEVLNEYWISTSQQLFFVNKKTVGEEKVTNIEELSESEKLENFKKEIWKEIDSMPW